MQNELKLINHPETACAVVESIESTLLWERGNKLTVSYRLKGMVERLKIAPEGAARRADDLWRHTCFELFIGAKNDVEYYEFNFSPSGEWAAYEFWNYREGGPLHVAGFEPKIAVQRSDGIVELSADLRPDALPGFRSGIRLWAGLSAVIEDLDGRLTYWALKHPPGKPDFHHPDCFALDLPFPGQNA